MKKPKLCNVTLSQSRKNIKFDNLEAEFLSLPPEIRSLIYKSFTVLSVFYESRDKRGSYEGFGSWGGGRGLRSGTTLADSC